MGDVNLHHHGDRDVRAGLVNCAVNVRRAAPPSWLVDRITADAATWAAYPDTTAARSAIAAFHGVPPAMVLVTNGAAEAFTLIARALAPRLRGALVVHPQFTEPEAALRLAGVTVYRHVLTAEDSFVFAADRVPAGPELVVVGNPTNPTGVLHPADQLHLLRRPGRVLVVDEAFMDAVPGEPETCIAHTDMADVLVVRSLTKTWALAGVRAGYVVGDPVLIAQLTAVQPPWSVSTPAVSALRACMSPDARAEAEQLTVVEVARRAALVGHLHAAGFPPAADSRAPFVLLDTGIPHACGAVAAEGFSVRRGETFPGLGDTWVRVAVRTEPVSVALADALVRARAKRGA